MSQNEKLESQIKKRGGTWLVTGVAGFIGSNLLEHLLNWNQTVIGVDNLSTGTLSNLEEVQTSVGNERWRRFTFHEGDIAEADFCKNICAKYVNELHQYM